MHTSDEAEASHIFWDNVIFGQLTRVAIAAREWWKNKDSMVYSASEGEAILDVDLHLRLRVYASPKSSAVKGFRAFPILEIINALPDKLIGKSVTGGYRRAVARFLEIHPQLEGMRLIYKQNLSNTCQSRGFLAFIPVGMVGDTSLYIRVPTDSRQVLYSLKNVDLKDFLLDAAIAVLAESILSKKPESAVMKRVWDAICAPRTDMPMPNDIEDKLCALVQDVLTIRRKQGAII